MADKWKNSARSGRATQPNPLYLGNWKVTVGDNSDTGSIMDTQRKRTGPYQDKEIGPQSVTGFGRNRQA